MNKRKPTPGPWAPVEVGQGGPADNPMPVYEIRSADGHAVIAEFVDGWNAPLLAAAPELLEACTAYLADRAEAGCTADSAAVRRMRAAIAKATGADHG